jgi:type II secretory pathway component PulC
MLRASPWWAVAGCAGVFISAPAVFAQETSIDFGNALRNLSLEQSARQSRLPVASPPIASSSSTSAASEPFVLLGVVISEDRRLALLQPAQAGGTAQLVPLGGLLEDHRLIDVQQDHVTLEGRGGERLLLKLASGHDARGVTASPAAAPAVRGQASGTMPFDERSRAAKEERRREIDESAARDKARTLTERFLSGGPSPTTAH